MNDDSKTKAGWWHQLTALATVASAGVGALATCVYNEQQTRFREIETVEKFFPHLISTDRRLSNMAKLTVRTLLSNPELADRLIRASVEVTTEEAATKPEISPEELTQRREARKKEAHGWAYLGDYSKSAGMWQTRYFDFPPGANPDDFTGNELKVRAETGSLNLRINMPTPAGTFPPVVDVLAPGQKVLVLDVKAWQSTGYMWAKISYSTAQSK